MKRTRNFLLTIALTTSLVAIAPISQAAHDANIIGTESTASEKATRGLTNIFTAPLEIPKNMINTVNDSNLALGLVGGLAKGILHTFGRIGVGFTELVSAPFDTQPIVYPRNIWDDYDEDTVYGPYFRVSEGEHNVMANNNDDQAALNAALAAADDANKRALAAEQAADRAARAAAETNQRIDNMFEKTMMK